jgi:nucleoside-diphosphate-sugar epimerase
MRIALFGGSGFVGRKVLEMLRETSATVVDISRQPSGSFGVAADITDKNALASVGGDFDCVAILSAQLPQKTYTADDLDKFVEVNIKGINNILTWASQRGVRKVIYCSTLSFLPTDPDARNGILIDIGSHYSYKITKAAGEHFALAFCREHKMECSSLRIGSVYGPGMQHDVIYSFFDKIRRKDLITIQNENILADFVHVNDVAATIVSCLTAPVKAPVINVTSDKPVSLVALASLLAKLMNQQPPRIEVISKEPVPQKDLTRGQVNAHQSITLETGLADLIKTWE